MKYPPDLKYTTDHAWVRVEGNKAVIIGITYYGQDSMGEITYVELPQLNKEIHKDQIVASIGSSKAFIDLPSPVSGKVLEVNGAADAEPTLLNKAPYGEGWLVKMTLSRQMELATLMDSTAYAEFILKGPG